MTQAAASVELRLPAKSHADVFRPIQYLGSKLRSLEFVVSEIGRIAPGGRVADPFAGTTVVSQALAIAGHRVDASDAMSYAAAFARALLGVDDRDRLEERYAAFVRSTA